MYPAVDFELSQFIRYPGNVLLADGRRKTQFYLAPLFDDARFKGEPQKVELLIVNPERWLTFLVAAAINDLRLLLA